VVELRGQVRLIVKGHHTFACSNLAELRERLASVALACARVTTNWPEIVDFSFVDLMWVCPWSRTFRKTMGRMLRISTEDLHQGCAGLVP
jgi:hypothetical protein